jgi:hypothetical protein
VEEGNTHGDDGRTCLEDVLVEEGLQLLVGNVDAQLLKAER